MLGRVVTICVGGAQSKAGGERLGGWGGAFVGCRCGFRGQEEEREERAKIGGYVVEIEERMGELNVLARERDIVLRDLKEKVTTHFLDVENFVSLF